MALLSNEQIEQRLASVSGWRVLDPAAIEREWQLADFAAALEFVNRVAALAQAADHHPDITLHGWNKVRLTLATHSAGGLTDADFDLAAAIDALG